ncbi:hypothetical protein K435DRAFT_879149 [Dendrothele bispora CBS 962.96]|uniref:Uncharacterized protein n=1 Tax=Dendrothele bispora (strain CBS 962.96) TaxID=1314807 RepID=A0A4S8KLT7_DENBC|nr:hypothetical protein K435DRAFT_879149 [Dendrothele bispora CBS 962.96]
MATVSCYVLLATLLEKDIQVRTGRKINMSSCHLPRSRRHQPPPPSTTRAMTEAYQAANNAVPLDFPGDWYMTWPPMSPLSSSTLSALCPSFVPLNSLSVQPADAVIL